MKTLWQIFDNKLWIHHDGENLCIDLDSDVVSLSTTGRTRSKKKKHHGPHSGEMLAPMPGRITKIFVSQGSSVKKGDAVLVMEAMKMEYTLKAETNGLVEKIFCSSGDQVNLGKILVLIKPEDLHV